MTHSNWARPPKTSPITPALTHTHTDRQTGTPSEAWLIYDRCRWFEHCVSARIIPCCPDFITSLFHSLTLVSLGFVLCATPVSFAKATQAFQQCRFGIFKSLTVLCMCVALLYKMAPRSWPTNTTRFQRQVFFLFTLNAKMTASQKCRQASYCNKAQVLFSDIPVGKKIILSIYILTVNIENIYVVNILQYIE